MILKKKKNQRQKKKKSNVETFDKSFRNVYSVTIIYNSFLTTIFKVGGGGVCAIIRIKTTIAAAELKFSTQSGERDS